MDGVSEGSRDGTSLGYAVGIRDGSSVVGVMLGAALEVGEADG